MEKEVNVPFVNLVTLAILNIIVSNVTLLFRIAKNAISVKLSRRFGFLLSYTNSKKYKALRVIKSLNASNADKRCKSIYKNKIKLII